MHSRIERIRSLCNTAARQMEATYPQLKVCFIVHGRGQFAEAIALYEDDITSHAASDAAQIILKKFVDQDQSSFLGLAMARKPVLFGLWRKDAILALVNINADSYGDMEQARHDIMHHAWHAVDLMQVRQQPENKGKYQTGPLIPKRSPYNNAKANMKADIFSATMRGLNKDRDTIDKLSKFRARNVLRPQTERMAEDYPFIIAMEATEFAFEDVRDYGIAKSRSLFESLKIADEVSDIVDESGIGIEQWWNFTGPAQDMAWRGFPASDILGAAINTSEDAYVRAIGYLIADIINTEPKSAIELMNAYNAFTHSAQNERLHREKMESIFEEMIDASLRQESSDVMLLEANAQNENLLSGNVIGWCAGALQASAVAFERAIHTGHEPTQAARIEFEGNKELTSWDAINTLSDKVIERRRMGYLVTLGHVAELCENINEVSEVLKSVQVTMQDADYVQKLKAANELHAAPQMAPTPEPTKPAPSPIAPSAGYTPQAPVPTPGMGGMAGTRTSHNSVRRSVINKESAADEQKSN